MQANEALPAATAPAAPPTPWVRLHRLLAPVYEDCAESDIIALADELVQSDNRTRQTIAGRLLQFLDPYLRAVASSPEMRVYTLRTLRRYPTYEVRSEVMICDDTPEPVYVESAYTVPDGWHIGDPVMAFRLAKRGIKPELRTETSNTCTIGFSEMEQRWYGWSHRAFCGFGIGSTIRLGDCGFQPRDRDEYLLTLIDWYTDDERSVVSTRVVTTGTEEEQGIFITYTTTPRGKTEPVELTTRYDLDPLHGYGRGEWTAETLEDARQMACDFAASI